METVYKIIGRIREWIARQDRKKLAENTAIVIIIGVIIIIAGSAILAPRKSRQDAPVQETARSGTAHADIVQDAEKEGDIETRLKSILSQIEGVGKVDVMITYSSTAEKVPAYDIKRSQDETEEKDSAGGTRKIRGEEYESSLAYEDMSSGGKSPVILKKLEPEIRGVLVVAEGAENIEVRDRICRAVTVVLDVSANRVQVVQRKK
ncbi:MAG TPA: stage III sporulation protein AG [Clostridiales bacterium]|nr:stage III sporulation protein AG [Clostridiales bacterium]HOL90874.1 stage III sporulation protein AG [Clostridiales bacterium]HPP35208.1 stage III sporulation protein AG [Clostridiales bacterium]